MSPLSSGSRLQDSPCPFMSVTGIRSFTQVSESQAMLHSLTLWVIRSNIPCLPKPSYLMGSSLLRAQSSHPLCRRTEGERAIAVGLTEQVIPGHICLFLQFHWLENEYPVMVEVLKQFFTVKWDPTASLHQIPVVRTRKPVYAEEPSFRKESFLSLLNHLKILFSFSISSLYFPFLEIPFFFFLSLF